MSTGRAVEHLQTQQSTEKGDVRVCVTTGIFGVIQVLAGDAV